MLGQYTLANNVKTTLYAAIDTVADSIIVNAATGLFNDPPDPTGDTASNGVAIATLTDAALPPTQTEIITYTGVTDNEDGTLTLTGVTRGVEDTVGRSFEAGAILFQAVTAWQLSSDVLKVDCSGPVRRVTLSDAILSVGDLSIIPAVGGAGISQLVGPASGIDMWVKNTNGGYTLSANSGANGLNAGRYNDADGNQLLGPVIYNWVAPGKQGSRSALAYNFYTASTLSNPGDYVQDRNAIQSVLMQVEALTKCLSALLYDLDTHGLISFGDQPTV